MNNADETMKNDFKRILVPIDGSKQSKKAAKIACELGNKLNKDIMFLHVIHIPATAIPPGEVTYNPNMGEVLREQGNKILNSFKEECSKHHNKIKTELIEGIPDDEIISEANKDDLIIMGSKGQSAIERIFIGSVTEKVIHHSDATVMVVR